MKYILVAGGVISGIGKGIVTSSIGALLKACNLRVTAIKIDPYLNIDAGLFSPYEHGEVFVLNDGSEVDLDLGNYERFLDTSLSGKNNITTGKIYLSVINKERQGDYQGKTTQIIPHITDAIVKWIEEAAIGDKSNQADVCMIELGGTIGDIEGMIFIEALRHLRKKVKRQNFCCCLVCPVILNGPSKELKTKPTQKSLSKLQKYGLAPDLIICRCEVLIPDSVKDKISMFGEVETSDILSLPDMDSIYQVPAELERQGIISLISRCLNIRACPCDRLLGWREISYLAVKASEVVQISLVGKYTKLFDCYMSVIKALEHACYSYRTRPIIHFIESSDLETKDGTNNEAWHNLKSSACLIVPGGFGIRGSEGKIAAIKWARENKLPFLGVCLGFQMAVVEYVRHVLGIENAHSNEFVDDLEDLEPVVVEMLDYKDPERKLGGTMRLGLKTTRFVVQDSILRQLYGNQDSILERHRHRFEISERYISKIEGAGMRFVGRNEIGDRMEILELNPSEHPYFVGVQYHPEYLSRPFKPSPPYIGLIGAALRGKSSNAPDL